MKNKIVFVGFFITVILFVLYGFSEENKGVVKCKPIDKNLFTNNNTFLNDFKGEKNLMYSVKGKHRRTITRKQLNEANSIGDLIEYYPSSWIVSYTSVKIGVIKNGKETKEFGKNNVFTKKQFQLLNSVKISDVVKIKVDYKTKNSVTEELEKSEMVINMVVVPDVGASFDGGYDTMITYLKENTSTSLQTFNFQANNGAVVCFSIDEKGKVINVNVKETSGNYEVDKELINLIKAMPAWKPAKNIKGETVIQEFEFTIRDVMC